MIKPSNSFSRWQNSESWLCHSELPSWPSRMPSGGGFQPLDIWAPVQAVSAPCACFFLWLLCHVLYVDGCGAPAVQAARDQVLRARNRGGCVGGPRSDSLLPGPCPDRTLHTQCACGPQFQAGPGAKYRKTCSEPRKTLQSDFRGRQASLSSALVPSREHFLGT